MRRLFSAAAMFVVVASSWAADEPKPNTLTPKEIADSWLLLFDGETTFGWKIDGEAKVQDGLLLLGGDKATTATPTTTFGPHHLLVEFAAWKGKVGSTIHVPGEPTLHSHPVLKEWSRFKGDVKPSKGPAAPVTLQVPAGSQLAVRNVKLKPDDLTPIFNGKDLTGWKEHPGKKSKFGINDKGELTIKEGPGDLQTKDQWADFVLQIDCFSNGKHLNSGVFFRCRPDEYQQGYEAQIHNGFTEQPNKEYPIEVYDPKESKLLETKKVKYTAIDYGTGGVYRRMPARKQMSKDQEWFTMTVIAQGRHIATWVNGVQVVDWTDNRPLKDNARNGCRLEKGPISLQGHDPTTDLSFRNIRIAPLDQ